MQAAFRTSSPLTRSFPRALCQRKSLSLLFTSRKSLAFNPRPNFPIGVSPAFSTSLRRRQDPQKGRLEADSTATKVSIRENIYTIPNVLTLSRIIACPVLGWAILDNNYGVATGLLVYAGLTDLVRVCICIHLTLVNVRLNRS